MRPNILYLHSHDTGRQIQPYGRPYQTANLQRLAEQGVVFRQAFCAGPTCSPSRAGLLTGETPHQAGMFGLLHRGWSLKHPERHLANFLKKKGYRTARFGVHHVSYDPHVVGFDEAPTERNCGALKTRQAVHEFFEKQPQEPFFMSVGFGETHRAGRGFAAEHVCDEDAKYFEPMPGLPDTPETRRDAAEFADSARRLDEHMGDVLDQLRRHGYDENTLVICTTDHGVGFPGFKCNLNAGGLGVMLMMRGPGGFAGGKVIDAMVSHLDVFPTLCDLLEADRPHWLRGESMLPLIRGECNCIREQCFGEVTYHGGYEPMRSCRTKRWSYIRRFDDRSRPVNCNTGSCPSKDVILEAGWAEQELCREELYDLMLDPLEKNNLADDPSESEVLEDMRQRLRKWMEETDDPLLQGDPPIPEEGILVDDPDEEPRKKQRKIYP